MSYWYYKTDQKGASPCGDKYCNHWLKKNRDACKAVRSCACNICEEFRDTPTYTDLTAGGYVGGGVLDDCLFACDDNPDITREEFIKKAIEHGSLTENLEPIPPLLANDYLHQQQLGEIDTGENDFIVAALFIALLFVILYIYINE